MKLKFLHARFLSAFVFVLASFSSIAVFAQPANDLCSNATELTLGASEATAVYTAGTTVGTVDGATTPGPSVCSGNFYRDDVWYKFTIPANATGKAISVRVSNAVANGFPSAGMAIYTSNACDATNAPYLCTNFAATDDATFKFSTECVGVGKEILVRVWSSVGAAGPWMDGEGAFEISAFYSDDNSATLTLWGANGEGSFDGGKGAWTTTSASCNGFELWQWSNTDYCTRGLYSTGGGLINSLTNCNGAMCFDSDYYDNGGTNGPGPGAGPCPAPQSGTLESPIIDLSGFPNVTGVNLVFSQALRKFQSMFFVDLSIDGGANWSPIEINTEAEDPILYPVNSPHVNNIRRIFLPGAAGQAQVKVRFRFEANYYYWIIDDVKITERESFNLKANAFAAISPNKLWQHDQLEPFGGLIDIANIGAQPMPSTSVSLDIKDATNTTIWSDELSFGTTAADSTYENNPMLAVFTHPNENLTTYSGTYTVSGAEPDFDITDNTQAFNWSVTDSTMSKENVAAVGSGVRPSTEYNYTWGNIYHIVNNKNDAGKQYQNRYVSVGISNPDALEGATMFVYLYKWNNEDADDVAQASERTTVGFAQFDFPAGEKANTLYTLPIFDFNTFALGVNLEANTDYIVAVEYTTPPDKPELACFIGSDGNIDYSAQTLRSTLPGLGPVRYNHVLDVGNSGDYNASTFAGGTTPIVRMHITIPPPVSTKEPALDAASKLVVAPNPVKNDLNLKIDLVKEAKNATIEIMDINGKILSVRQLNNVKTSIEKFDVSNYANGSYILNFKSADGVRAVQFIVAN